MFVPLLVCLSSLMLQCVSAGGVYCAKTARARAAALGLDYPGVHGAPDLNGPPHYGMHPRSMPQTYEYEGGDVAGMGPDTSAYRHSHPGLRPLDDRFHNRAHPRSFESAFPPDPDTYYLGFATHQGLDSPRGWSNINHRSNSEQVKHVAPRAPSQHDLVSLNPQGRSHSPSFVNNGHDLVDDESVPNRRDIFPNWPPLSHSRGRGTYRRGDGPRREVPILGSAGFTNTEDVGEQTSQGPSEGRLNRRLSGRFAHPLHRNALARYLAQRWLEHFNRFQARPAHGSS